MIDVLSRSFWFSGGGGAAISNPLQDSFLPLAINSEVYSGFTPTIANGSGDYTFVITGLPTGLTFSATTGAISGTPSDTTATIDINIEVTDNVTAQVDDVDVDLILYDDLQLTTSSPLTDGEVDAAYSVQLGATGGSGTRTYAVTTGTLPTGLSLSSGGLLSGTPTVTYDDSFTVTVTDSVNSDTDAVAYSLVVSAAIDITDADAYWLDTGTKWLETTQTTVATTGETIGSWNDEGAGNLDLEAPGAGTAEPILQADGSVRFGSTATYMRNFDVAAYASGGIAFSIVGHIEPTFGNDDHFLNFEKDFDAFNFIRWRAINTNKYELSMRGGSGDTLVTYTSGDDTFVTGEQYFALISDGSTIRLRINDAEIIAASAYSAVAPTVDNFTVFAKSSGNNNLVTDVWALGVFDFELTDAQSDSLYDFFFSVGGEEAPFATAQELYFNRNDSNMYVDTGDVTAAYNTSFLGSIEDQSTNAYAITATARPLICLQALQFHNDGNQLIADDIGTDTFANGTEAFTIHAYIKNVLGGTIFAFSNSGGDDACRVRYVGADAIDILWEHSTANNSTSGTVTGLDVGHVFTAVFSGGDTGTLTIYIDNVEVHSLQRHTGNMTIDEFRIGLHDTYNLDGDIASLLVYSVAHDNTQRGDMVTWFETEHASYIYEQHRRGFARDVTGGGDSGTLIEFTNLNNSGTGSLRAAMEQDDVIVVPDPSLVGWIQVDSGLSWGENVTLDFSGNPNIGIAQSASMSGSSTMSSLKDKFLCQYVRIAAGNASHRLADVDINDEFADNFRQSEPMQITPNNGEVCSGALFRYCEFMGGSDGQFEISGGSAYPQNIDAEWCYIGRGLTRSTHDNGWQFDVTLPGQWSNDFDHNMGGLIGYGANRIAFINCLIYACGNRVMYFQDSHKAGMFGCIIFDTTNHSSQAYHPYDATYNPGESWEITYVGNLNIINGPDTNSGGQARYTAVMLDYHDVHGKGNICALRPSDSDPESDAFSLGGSSDFSSTTPHSYGGTEPDSSLFDVLYPALDTTEKAMAVLNQVGIQGSDASWLKTDIAEVENALDGSPSGTTLQLNEMAFTGTPSATVAIFPDLTP